jgi:HEAT repeat protein
MHVSRFVALSAPLLLVLPLGRASAASPAAVADDERTLAGAHVGTDGASLLQYFRKRTIQDVDGERIKQLIEQLGDDSFDVRQKASSELAALGTAAVNELRRAARYSDDIEVVRRAERCLQLIETGSGTSVPAAAARLLAVRKPEGTARVLLAYLPTVDRPALSEEIRHTLTAVALRGGQADPALVAALSDRSPVRRAAAAEALLQGGAAGERPAVARLLRDPDATVRLRVGLLLARARDRSAVSVLIDLLGELPRGQAWQVYDFLSILAGDKAPTAAPGTDPESRRQCRDAWAAWWKKEGGPPVMAKLDQPPQRLGYTMMVLLDRSLVVELDAQNKPRWQIEGLLFPLDAQMLANGHVLVAEQKGDRVTERTTKGEVVWQKEVEGPLMAQRLDNGNTFIATRNELIEVDRDGKQVANYIVPGGDGIKRAAKLPNGDIACVTEAMRYVRFTPSGNVVDRFAVNVFTSGGRIDVLPNRHLLAPEMHTNRVVEYDRKGKAVWEAEVEQPIAAVRLSNGHTLVTSMTSNRALELDGKGKEVWQYQTDTRVTRAWRR